MTQLNSFSRPVWAKLVSLLNSGSAQCCSAYPPWETGKHVSSHAPYMGVPPTSYRQRLKAQLSVFFCGLFPPSGFYSNYLFFTDSFGV